MLQWMGGSRRKVTATRKSTQKRQKQYFEQRKRQQQQQQTTGLETSDGVTTCSQYQTNNQSLDILSLLNLSTVVQNYKSSCHSARENSDDSGMTENHHITNFPPPTPSYKATPADPIESKEARNPSGSEVDNVYRKMVLSSAPDIQNRDLIGNSDKMDQLKMTSERQLSVFDLVAHDGPNDNLEGSPEHEAHVAFAVEGLGKVEIETPAHSPQTPGRIFSYGSSSPLKASRQPRSSKNLNNLVYDLELDTGAVVQDNDSGSFLDLPFCSRGIAKSFNKRRQKLFTAKECSQFNSNAYQLKNHFADDEIFYNIEGGNDNIWNDGDFLDESCDITWKNSPLNMDGNSADYWIGNRELSDFDIEGRYLKKIRVTQKATGRFNISEPLARYSKQRRSEGDHDFRTPDGTWYPTLERNCDFRDATNHPAWSCYVTEDAGESLSLSEESCSSSAVRGRATKRSPSNSAARQNTRRHGDDIRSPVNRSSVENVYAKYGNYAKSDDGHERKRINGPGKFTKTWNPSSSNPDHFSNHIFPKNFGPEDRFLFEEGYISADRDSGFGSFCQTPGAKQRSPTDAKLWIEDPFRSYLLPEVHSNVKSSFQGPKHDFLHEFSPPVSFSSEKLEFCQPHSLANSYETPIFSTIGSARSKLNLFVDSKVEDELRDLFPAVGSQGDAEFFHVSVEESVAKAGENRSDIQPADFLKFELQKDGCIGSNDLSSKNGGTLEESDSKDNCSDFKEAKDLTPELENEKATGSPEHAEATSSSVKIPEKFEHSTDEKEYHNDSQVSLRQKNENSENEDSGPKERKLDSKVQTTSLDPSYDVMMLESYVLQLLCVQKVLKEPSGNHTVKKV